MYLLASGFGLGSLIKRCSTHGSAQSLLNYATKYGNRQKGPLRSNGPDQGLLSYCWWKKSYTTWDVKNPVNNGINMHKLSTTWCRISSINSIIGRKIQISLHQRLRQKRISRQCSEAENVAGATGSSFKFKLPWLHNEFQWDFQGGKKEIRPTWARYTFEESHHFKNSWAFEMVFGNLSRLCLAVAVPGASDLETQTESFPG